MSGIEIAGIVLGAFPLLISAMENFEKTKKKTRTWWTAQRAHKQDVGKIKDCQLGFKLNLKVLLLPLVRDGVVDKGEHERLLADPGGQGWKEDRVDDALRERLADCHERYLEVLQDIQELMLRLSKECRVDDASFQTGLKAMHQTPSTHGNQHAQRLLMLKANAVFEAKRIQYAFTEAKRDELLRKIDTCNDRLQNVLAQNDRVSNLDQRRTSTLSRSSRAKQLKFYSHAASTFRLLDKIWTCQCRSQARLWLQHLSFHNFLMKMHLKLCSGPKASTSQSGNHVPSVLITSRGTTRAATRSHGGSTLTLISRSTSTSGPSSTLTAARPSTISLENDGLCRTHSTVHNSNNAVATSLGRLSDGDHDYAVYPIVHDMPSTAAATLADVLDPRSKLRLTRVERYGIALTLASSHLQLHSTPWLQQHWTCEDVCFPTSANGSVVTLHGEPYILADLSSTASSSNQATTDRTFSTLGIVLLELCFGCRLEGHPLWSDPKYSVGRANPNLRQAVAFEWLGEVQGEAGKEYAAAVTWTLLQVPPNLKDDSWRADFAQNVVQPLQRYYEYLHPKK